MFGCFLFGDERDSPNHRGLAGSQRVRGLAHGLPTLQMGVETHGSHQTSQGPPKVWGPQALPLELRAHLSNARHTVRKIRAVLCLENNS